MVNLKRMTYSVIIMLVTLTVFSSAAQDSAGSIRFFHAIPGAPSIDVYVGGELTAANLEFGEATNYINVTSGTLQITVRPTGLATDLWTQDVTVSATPITMVASSASNPQFNAYEDNFSALNPTSSRFSIVHAIEDGPAVAVVANGEPGPTLEYSQFAGTFDVPAGIYQIGVNSAADESEIIPVTPLGFTGATTQMVIAYGTPTRPEVVVLPARVPGEADNGLVRIAHTVADAPAVDIYVDGTLVVPALAFGEWTEHLSLPANNYGVELRESGTDNVLLTNNLSVESGVAVTVVAAGTADALELNVVTDEIGGITPNTALLTLVNTIPGDSSVTAEFDDGTTLVSDLEFLGTSDVISTDPSVQTPVVTFTLDGQSATLELDEEILYGGVYYNVFAVTGTMFSPPTLLFAPTSIVQEPGSAPGADEMMVSVFDTETTETESETTQDTETSTEVTTDTAVATQPPVQPTVAPTAEPFPTVPPVVTDPELPTARIILDPGVNLQLRQYPSSQALSLGLAPSGSTVTVVGREGAPIDIITGEEIVLEGEDSFVDPAEGLPEEEDLPPEETWVNFIYPTPDGGEISAWTLALYLDIRNPEGEPQRLADLETVPRNQPGEALATNISSPTAQEDRVTIEIIGLDVGVNLNVRRNPDSAAEVLARIPNGTIADLLGVTEDEDWAFVELSPAEGGTITGWLSTNFVQYQLNGEDVNVETLVEEDLYPLAEGTEIGEISEGAPTVAQPTVDPLQDAYVATVLVDADANLNLRRDPNAQAEVLVQIPGGSQIIIDGRTQDSDWLRTFFEGQIGWVASDFVSLTFNGAAVEIDVLPIIPIETDTDEDDTEEDADATDDTDTEDGSEDAG